MLRPSQPIVIGLLAVGGCLVSLAAVALSSMSPRNYDERGGPEATAYNYLLALTRGDYERAHLALSDGLAGRPETVAAFAGDLQDHQMLLNPELEPCVYLETFDRRGEHAYVALRVQFYDPCWRFADLVNLSSNRVVLTLVEESEGWRIIEGTDFFVHGWIKDDS